MFKESNFGGHRDLKTIEGELGVLNEEINPLVDSLDAFLKKKKVTPTEKAAAHKNAQRVEEIWATAKPLMEEYTASHNARSPFQATLQGPKEDPIEKLVAEVREKAGA